MDKTAYADNAAESCNCEAGWFPHEQTPAPAEGDGSPFDSSSTTNCIFHQWSWQKFLWLTNEVNGKPFFMTNLIQVNAAGQKLDPSNGIVLTDTAQASSNTDILQTPKYQSGVPKQTTVYYSIFMYKLLYDTMIKYGPIAKSDPSKVKDITFPVGAGEPANKGEALARHRGA